MDRLNPRIMYSEDDENTLREVSDALQCLGISVDAFSTNQLAYDAFVASMGTTAYTGAIADYQTPGTMSGLEFLQQLATTPQMGQLLILSSSGDRAQFVKEAAQKGILERIVIFNKVYENAFAILYIALQIRNPELMVTRKEIVEFFGHTLDCTGAIQTSSFPELAKWNWEIIIKMTSDNYDYDDFVGNFTTWKTNQTQ